MQKIIISIAFSMLISAGFSQSIPTDSLYLGQKTPGKTPKVFKLSVSPQKFAAERIAISNDGKEIYYSEIKSYYPVVGDAMKYYSYSGVRWTGPFNLFEGYNSSALSVTEDTMFFERNYETFHSIKKGLNWSNPKKIVAKVDSAHYLQATNNGHYYVSSRLKTGVGAADWCKLSIKGADTTAVGLDRPLNTTWDNLDFFVPRDESYMITTSPFGLCVSYHKKDGNWTNPRNLGSKINFGIGMWGPYVSSDNKYLFYTTGTKLDYSDVNVYWVRIDGTIDSLKNTNISPYATATIKNQTATVGQSFNLTLPENLFIDEDSKVAPVYSANLVNGNPLPLWLSFNPDTKTFSGTPTDPGDLRILLIATDAAKGFGVCVFKIHIADNLKK